MNNPPVPDVVCFGEVLWDILPEGPLPGGAPMNVAYHLKKLGLNPALISRVGTDEWGEKLLAVLRDHGIPVNNIQLDKKYPTGIVYAKPNENNEVVYDIVHPSAWDFISWDESFISLMEQSAYFVFGSLSSRNETSRATLHQLIRHSNKRVLDINIRPPHFKQSDIEWLLQHTDILKLNINELELVAGWYNQFADPADKMKLLQDKFELDILITTMGEEGAMVRHEGRNYRHEGIEVVVKDTIGSGDAFLAGFLASYHQHADVERALLQGSVMGAFIATKAGACPDYSGEEMKQ
jgi:fructokinase